MKKFLTLTLLLIASPVLPAPSDSLPRISPQILDAASPLPVSLREEFYEGLIQEIKTYGCGVEAVEPGVEADWIFKIEVREFREYTDYDTTVLDRAKNFDPNVRNQLTARIEFRGAVFLQARAYDKPLVKKRFYVSKGQRPVNLSFDEEWAREEARQKLVASTTGEWRKLICKQASRAKRAH